MLKCALDSLNRTVWPGFRGQVMHFRVSRSKDDMMFLRLAKLLMVYALVDNPILLVDNGTGWG